MAKQAGRKCRKPKSYSVPIYRLRLVQDGTAEISRLTTPKQVARYLGDFATADREQMIALFLDTKNQPIGQHLISVGTINMTPVQPRDVFRAALVVGAVNAIILAHNHTTGDVTPSCIDDALTHRIAAAGELLGVELLDHLILGPNGNVFSYKAQRPEWLNERIEMDSIAAANATR